MGLMEMWEEVLNGELAIVTLATVVTDKPKTPPSVARVTVESSQTPKIERPTLRLVHPANTEQETALHARRVQSFQAKGIADHQATALADSLVKRDRQLDDRRSCGECKSFYADNCRQRITSIGRITAHTLHRCRGFAPEFSEEKQYDE